MDEETMYPICPDRNVVAAFQCFLGPDSRGMDRFLGDERIHWADDALLIVQARGRWALAGIVYRAQRSRKAVSRAVADFNSAITWWLAAATYLLWALGASAAVCTRYVAYHVGTALKRAATAAARRAWRYLGLFLDLLDRRQVHHPI